MSFCSFEGVTLCVFRDYHGRDRYTVLYCILYCVCPVLTFLNCLLVGLKKLKDLAKGARWSFPFYGSFRNMIQFSANGCNSFSFLL